MNSPNPARTGRADDTARALARLGRLGSRRLVFDSGLVSLDDPRIVALNDTYEDLKRVFHRGERPKS